MAKAYYECSFAYIEVVEEDGIITECNFNQVMPAGEKILKPPTPLLAEAISQLDEYFRGKRKKFDLPLKVCGTPFQQKVLKEVMKVPFGKTASYQEIAERIGNPKAVRAVGTANRNNSVPLLIPCHRIISKSGEVRGGQRKESVKLMLLRYENPRFGEK